MNYDCTLLPAEPLCGFVTAQNDLMTYSTFQKVNVKDLQIEDYVSPLLSEEILVIPPQRAIYFQKT